MNTRDAVAVRALLIGGDARCPVCGGTTYTLRGYDVHCGARMAPQAGCGYHAKLVETTSRHQYESEDGATRTETTIVFAWEGCPPTFEEKGDTSMVKYTYQEAYFRVVDLGETARARGEGYDLTLSHTDRLTGRPELSGVWFGETIKRTAVVNERRPFVDVAWTCERQH